MKAQDRHLTYNQMTVLDTIAKAKRAGIKLWYTDLSLATIRSLCKRGFIDTRRGGRVVATWRGKRRLKMPWPKKPVENLPQAEPEGEQIGNGYGINAG